MIRQAEKRVGTAPGARIGRPPIPHEHGAWVILYAPLLIGFGAALHGTVPIKWLLLTLAVMGAFLAREAAGLLLRGRGKAGTGFWLAIYAAAWLAGGLPLLLLCHLSSLLWIGALMVILFALHSLLLVRGRLDRSQWGEILGVGALTLTAPAAYSVATAALDFRAWLVWAGCLLYFSGPIFYVKMLLAAAKSRRAWSEEKRREIGRDTFIYHALLAITLLGVALRIGGDSALWLGAAYLPTLLRAFYRAVKLTPELPPLKRIGIQETLHALWFMICFLTAIRMLY
jgi:hypothetical protein